MIFFFDLILTFFLLILFLPLGILIALLILIFDGLPIFHNSKRIGKNFKLFNIYKFRTMEINKGKDKITFLGKILRRTSLDEIPQFFNVLKGDMSLVGPRPFPEGTLNKLSKKKRVIRCSVRPGLTGYSQVNYKGKKRSLNQKVAQDIVYINNRDIWLYFRILFFTPMTLLRRFFLNKSGKSL